MVVKTLAFFLRPNEVRANLMGVTCYPCLGGRRHHAVYMETSDLDLTHSACFLLTAQADKMESTHAKAQELAKSPAQPAQKHVRALYRFQGTSKPKPNHKLNGMGALMFLMLDPRCVLVGTPGTKRAGSKIHLKSRCCAILIYIIM